MSRGGLDTSRDRPSATFEIARTPDDNQPSLSTRGLPVDDIRLPQAADRQPVDAASRHPARSRDRLELRDSETRILATVGAFRVVSAPDLADTVHGTDRLASDLRHLQDEGLIQRRIVVINDHPTPVVALTNAGRDLLETHRDRDPSRSNQAYYAGLVKPRELAHDAQLYRAFRAEAARLEAAGGRIYRVVLDYELKRDYQTFLNRSNRPAGNTDADREAFAAAHKLPIIDRHLELPDLRIEYDTQDGERLYRDVELVTRHYSRGQMAGKAAAGFSLYRAGGSASSKGGSTPQDPHHLEWLK